MRHFLSFLLPLFVVLLVAPGCPLDIRVRCDDGNSCDAAACESDFQCPSGARCEDSRCVPGLRLGDACEDSFECPDYALCNIDRDRCEEICNPNVDTCEPGYRCAPDDVCVEECTGTPATLGQTCENSLDCARCGVCLESSGFLRCRQPCRLDRDCPGGADGACETVGDSKACRL